MRRNANNTIPRDVVTMLHLLSRWCDDRGIRELRIEPTGGEAARITRFLDSPPFLEHRPKAKGKKPRRLQLGQPSPVTGVAGQVDLLPLTYSGGTSGLADIRVLKRCPRCKQRKFIAEFTRQPGQADGRGAYCSPCKVSMAKQAVERRRNQPDTTAAARFWPKVDKHGPEECWIWKATKTTDGYGHFCYRGRNSMGAHLVAYELIKGLPPPKGLRSHHVCGNRACVNPAHLIFATQLEISRKYAKPNPFNTNAKRTACRRKEHPFTPANTHHVIIGGLVTRVCLACLRERYPGTRKTANRRSDAIAPRAGRLLARMRVATQALAAEIREDARSIVTLEILGGGVTKETLGQAIKKATREAWRGVPSRWAVSLDQETIDGGEPLVERFADPSPMSDPAMALEESLPD